MPDEDISKRCFHCVFTDCKGTDGKMGFITPDLLAKLFAYPGRVSEKLESARKPSATSKVKSNKELEGMEMEMNAADPVVNGDGDSD
jgi:hypothetical protein